MTGIPIEFSEPPKEADYLIAYIDILGTKEYVAKGESKEIFDLIHGSFVMSTKILPQLELFGFGNLKFKIFSDNILIALKTDKTNIEEAFNLLSKFLKIFLLLFVMKGTLFRGGISYGKLAIDDIIVWGKGLVDAVFLEERIAIYPRIVLNTSLVSLLKDFCEKEEFENKYSCVVDDDGCCYYDYIDYKEPVTGKWLKANYTLINQKLSEENDPKIVQKYYWHLNYLNHAKDKFNYEWSETSFEIEW